MSIRSYLAWPGAPLGTVFGIAGKYGSSGFLAAFDADTGKKVWQFDSTQPGWEGGFVEKTAYGVPLPRDIAKEKAEESIAAMQQAAMALDEAQAALQSTIQGSAQDEVLQARSMLLDAGQNLTLVQGAVKNSISSAENYAGRL